MDYADECLCPGPTEDGYEYHEHNSILFGRKIIVAPFGSEAEGYTPLFPLDPQWSRLLAELKVMEPDRDWDGMLATGHYDLGIVPAEKVGIAIKREKIEIPTKE